MRIPRTLPLLLAALLASAASAAAATPPAAIAYVGPASHQNPQVRPAWIVLSGDSSNILAGARRVGAKIDWRSWGASSALGTGKNWIDDCEPSCAAGKFHGTPVKLQLSSPKLVGGHLIFTRLKITYYSHHVHTQTLRASYLDGAYDWA
jgi:hypothetical protein